MLVCSYIIVVLFVSFVVLFSVVLFVPLFSNKLPKSREGASKCITVAPSEPHSIAIIPTTNTSIIFEFVDDLILIPPLFSCGYYDYQGYQYTY